VAGGESQYPETDTPHVVTNGKLLFNEFYSYTKIITYKTQDFLILQAIAWN
jgi:hypothetical protein